MPLVDMRCIAGHDDVCYVHHIDDFGCDTRVCACGATLGRVLSLGTGITYFEQGRGRWIHNLGHEPIYVTSHRQHDAAMRRAGVEWVTHGQSDRWL